VKVSFVIVTWNSGRTLGACIESIQARIREPEHEIIVVDNASDDKSYLEPFRGRAGIRIVDNAANLGFARANNIGASLATGDCLAILNPDVVFRANPLPRLLATLEAHSDIAAIGPLLEGEDGRPQVSGYYYAFPGFLQTLLVRTQLVRLGFVRRLALRLCHSRVPSSGLARVDQIPGAFLLFRRSAIPGVKVLDEDYFIWMEDVDFCRRIADSGRRVAVLADERVMHIGGVSFGQWTDRRKRRVSLESYLTYLRKHAGPPAYWIHWAVLLADSLALTLSMGLKNLLLLRFAKGLDGIRAEAGVLLMILRGFAKPQG
jgi:GT2 family glycosyltransferase